MNNVSSSKATYVVAILVGVLLLELGGLGGWLIYDANQFRKLWVSELEKSRAIQEEQLAEQRAEQEKATKGQLVKMESVSSDCLADKSLATCYLTNFTNDVVTVCMQGVVMQKESAGIRLYSMPMCSGPIHQLQTVSVSAPWQQGNPTTICHNERNFLDWDECKFNVIDFNPGDKSK